MKIWLDDIRVPYKFGRIGWTWVKTTDECIEALKKGDVKEISLDHDLSEKAMLGNFEGEKTGYEVVLWMIENNVFPEKIYIHSFNPAGRDRMRRAFESVGVYPIIQIEMVQT